MNHLPFIIASYAIALGVITIFSLMAYFRLRRDEKLCQEIDHARK